MALLHFLLVYDVKQQKLIQQDRFENGREAAAAYADAEHRYGMRTELQIVLVGADSIETIMRTHGFWPRRCWIVRSVPAPSRWVAPQWRKVCGETRLVRPQRRATLRSMCQTALREIGCRAWFLGRGRRPGAGPRASIRAAP